MRGAVEVRGAVHGVAPLRYHNADGCEMCLDLRSRWRGGYACVVDQQGLALDGCVGEETVAWDVMG